MQSAHDLNVERLQRVTRRLNKVNASVNSVVNNIHPVDLVFGIKVGVKTLLDVLDDRPPRIIVVDKVTKARCINDCET